MSDYQQNYMEESEYLKRTLEFIKSELQKQKDLLRDRKSNLKAVNKDMWENSAHFTEDFEKLTEVNQYLADVGSQTAGCINTASQVKRYEKALKSPYFGRFDFVEEASNDKEKIYIGMYNIIDQKTQDIFVYDWRAPVSSIFYRYELGQASYKAPFGTITGDVSLKRQYNIEDSELKYFFDCSIKIDDEILQKILSRNSSPKMRNIVETIQREQDIIIRDTDNELLVVQGVAGSGKTSIALHRIAFLLYHGLSSNLNYRNVMIISPNTVFSGYISSVLPELGEENVSRITFDEYVSETLKEKGNVETRSLQIESIIASKDSGITKLKERCIAFKGSRVFVELLDRFIGYYERRMISFEDIYYDGKIIESRQQLKNLFLDNKINMPAAKRLKRMESVILDKIRPMQKRRLEKIEAFVQKMGGHEFDIKPYSRLLSIKETKALLKTVRKFTEIDYYDIYKMLFKVKGLFNKVSQGLNLPDNIEQIIMSTRENLENGFISYEDCAALLYLKLKFEDSDEFSGIRQVVIDEAQDYYPIHYEIFRMLFKDAGYTVLGDINQSVEKEADTSSYATIVEILNKRKSVMITLNKSYRSSYEINSFTQMLLNKKQDIVAFERHDKKPEIIYCDTLKEINQKMLQDIDTFLKSGYESVAVICKTVPESEKLYLELKDSININLMSSTCKELEKGVMVIPVYMAKGLEFDVVLVYNVTEDNYSAEFDRRLLYIACTRALHRLNLYYTGAKSPFIIA